MRSRRMGTGWGLGACVLLSVGLVSYSVPARSTPSFSGDPCAPGVTQILPVADPSAPDGLRRVWVHRPAGGDDPSVPVVYFLHGLPGSFQDPVTAGFAGILDQSACLTGRPVVFAAPDGAVASGADSEWADDVEGSFQLESFVTSTLIQSVEGGNRRAVGNRAIAGFSMGGFGAVSLALRHRIYGRVVSLAGYYVVDDPDAVFGAAAGAHDPQRLLARGHGLPMLLEDAASDPDSLTRGEAVRFGTVMRQRHLPVSIRVKSGNHSLAFVAQQLPSVLAWLNGGWPRA